MTRCSRCNESSKRLRAVPVVVTPGQPEKPAFELVCERCARAPQPANDTSRLERALRKVSRG